jgi:hypothetical protein
MKEVATLCARLGRFSDRLAQELAKEIGSVRQAAFEQRVPVVRMLDLYAFRAGCSDVISPCRIPIGRPLSSCGPSAAAITGRAP